MVGSAHAIVAAYVVTQGVRTHWKYNVWLPCATRPFASFVGIGLGSWLRYGIFGMLPSKSSGGTGEALGYGRRANVPQNANVRIFDRSNGQTGRADCR
jgi:hypothetical protein